MNHPIGQSPFFAAETRVAIDAAFEKACGIIDKEGLGEDFRFRVAKQIFYLAHRGETDVHRLCVGAMSKILKLRIARERREG